MNSTTCVARAACLIGAMALFGAGCSAQANDDETPGAAEALSSNTKSFTTRGTAYFPEDSALEGGFNDRRGKPLHTLQDFLAGSAPYVAVAMDTTTFAYGTRLRIHEINDARGKDIVFRVVDTGGAFRGKGLTRMDICTASKQAALDPVICTRRPTGGNETPPSIGGG